MKSREQGPNKTKAGISGKVLYAGNRQKPSGCMEAAGMCMSGRDNTANPKYSKYEDTGFKTHHKD